MLDKLKDLETAINVSDKRSAEDCNALQNDMLDKYQGEEVLRFECRIGDMKKFNDIAKKLGIKVEYNDFETLFSSEISKQICLYFWDIIIDGIKHLIFHDTDIDKIFHFLSEKKKFSEAKVISTIGAFCLSNKFGAKFLRGYSHKKYQDVMGISKSLDYSQSYTLKVAYQIKKDLIKFIPIRDNHEELTKTLCLGISLTLMS